MKDPDSYQSFCSPSTPCISSFMFVAYISRIRNLYSHSLPWTDLLFSFFEMWLESFFLVTYSQWKLESNVRHRAVRRKWLETSIDRIYNEQPGKLRGRIQRRPSA